MKKPFIISGLLFAATSKAVSFYCSTQGGNGYVNTGDTMARVQATCGVPTSTYRQQTSNVMQQQIQTWIYSPRILNSTNNNLPYGQSSNENSNNQLPSVSFELINQQVTAINSSQQGQVQQWNCPNGLIGIGASASALSNACGQPTTVNNNSQQISTQAHSIVYWSYQVNQYSKPIIMQFQDGYLAQVGQQQ